MAVKNWKNYLVKIIVPGLAGKDYLATGYPFRKNCILTARHAIHQHDHDPDREWRFLWRKTGADGKPVEKKIKSLLIVNSDKNLDWAVIQFEFDASLHNTVSFRKNPPMRNIDVESEGFPKHRHDEDHPHFGWTGTYLVESEDVQDVQVNLDSELTIPNDYRGMSGSPIFECDGAVIVGLFRKVMGKSGGRCILALPSSAMLQDPPFKKLLDIEHKNPRYTAIKQLLQVFQKSDIWPFLNQTFKQDESAETVAALAAAIAKQTTRQCLLSIYQQTQITIQKNQPVHLNQVLDFCQCLLPEYVSDDDKKLIRQYLKGEIQGRKGVKLSAATYEGAETRMARYDGRDMALDRVTNKFGSKFLRGALCMEFPEAAGGELDIQSKQKMTEEGFYAQFAYQITQQRQLPRLSGSPEEQESARKRLRQSASKKLKFLSEREKKTYYTIHMPGNDRHLVELLAEQCPYFLLLHLKDDDDAIEEEAEDFFALNSLYALKPENTP